MVIYLFTALPATLLLLSLQRVPSSSSTVQGASLALLLSSLSYPACLIPLCLLSCVDSFDTAPPPCYPACLAHLCLLSCVDSFDTAPPPPQDLLAGFLYTAPSPPQDLLAGLLYAAPSPLTSDSSFDSYLSSP
ncbi:hypothetical protein NDA11_006717 [Ustilago hordei]|uniref:Uncharacterized protein n=1 Tax=Ustilago hordei TaxID=120017 RepID=I2FSS4_USTHO|nr:hypothetical protein NDA10_000680 [Ustilago hordei]KAJ1571011.1 hypothetical protein NDA11_006717 [Ustilago hordei]KAJ1587467.1 hypothetical protein NDA15_005806 [Ustilago hordei]KAJ1590413.1 hypothetical protein NDA12_007078 [Ustilago hordei]UTT96641.1 hypothetical protein NDA17_001189 [Ustilago hordei]